MTRARLPLVLALAVIGLPLCLSADFAGLPGLADHGTAQAADEISVDELLRGFSKMPGLYAEFRQESHFGMLAEPLVDVGTIHFANGRLARRTTAPVASVVIMDGEGIEYGDGQKTERIDLEGKPAIRQFVDAFTKIFAGDRPGLEKLYRMSFTAGEGRSWTLTLVPKVSPMDEIIAKVVVEGQDLEIAKMRVLERGGDETVTYFSKVDTKRKYSKSELRELFSVD